MTKATTVLLAQLRAHVGHDVVKKKSLRNHIGRATGRPMDRKSLSRYLAGAVEPGADVLIPMLRWLQLEGVIIPTKKDVGLFAYANPMKRNLAGLKKPVKRS